MMDALSGVPRVQLAGDEGSGRIAYPPPHTHTHSLRLADTVTAPSPAGAGWGDDGMMSAAVGECRGSMAFTVNEVIFRM